MEDVFTILRGLEKSRDVDSAMPLIVKLRKFLNDNPDDVQQKIKNFFAPTVRGAIRSIDPEFEDEFSEIDVFSYVEDSERHISLFVAALQHHSRHRDDFEQIIMDSLVKKIEDYHLDAVINDINVNQLQWVAGNTIDHSGV